MTRFEMKNLAAAFFLFAFGVCGVMGRDHADLPQAQVYTGGAWLSFGCRTLDSIEDYTVNPEHMELSTYGGWKARRIDEGTGFFRVEQIDGRWWAVDPEGYLYIHKALNSINLTDYTADDLYQLLPQYGFNGMGCWSDEAILLSESKASAPLAYCPKVSFIAEYRRDRDPRIEMPVFDDEFEAYSNDLAEYFRPYVNDPQVFGYFSDNELAWRDEGLPAHLEIADPSDKNYVTAIRFLEGRGKTVDTWDTEDQYAYMALMAERYYSVVSAAIKAVDPNHMYIGSRCHSTEKGIKDFMVNAGKYVDIFTMNHYNRWGARDYEIHNMSEWSGRPLMATEFYAMEKDPESDVQGAGWPVLDQASRGLFYQHFVSTLAETGDLVGWHWFKFQDANDGANKGIVDASGNLYTNLLSDMQQMNSQIYSFIDYVDRCATPDVSLLPEADAYFKGNNNYGADPDLRVKASSGSVLRQAYLRFDVSALKSNIVSASIQLVSVAAGSESSNYQAELVEDERWDEMTITYSNNPDGSTVLDSWSHGDDVEIDVTDELLAALAGDGRLSIRVISTLNNGNIAEYGSRENTSAIVWPKLSVEYDAWYSEAYESWAEESGLTQGLNDGHGDDPDSDRMENLLEFAFGSHPLIHDAAGFRPVALVTAEGGTNYLNYVYRCRSDRDECGLEYTVSAAGSLSDDSFSAAAVEAFGSGAIDGDFVVVTNRVPMDAAAEGFIRLQISAQ